MKHLVMVAIVFGAAGGLAVVSGIPARAEQGGVHDHHFADCAKACAACQVQCDSCFHHCAALVAKGDKDHVKSMHTCVDCADVCAVAARLTARESLFSGDACACCAKCCDVCAAACEKFKDDKHMAECALACRACAKACRTMIEHL